MITSNKTHNLPIKSNSETAFIEIYIQALFKAGFPNQGCEIAFLFLINKDIFFNLGKNYALLNKR